MATDTFFIDVEMVINSFTEVDVERIRQMLSELDSIAQTLPKTASRCYNYKARLYSKLGEHENALKSIDQAIERAPHNLALVITKGRLFAAAGRLAEAIAEFDRVLAAEPDSVKALLHRGDTYRRMGDVAHARADYQTALDIDPGSQPIRDRLEDLEA